MTQPLPLELEFELTKIYQQINAQNEATIKSIFKTTIRNLYVAAMFCKESDEFFTVQKKKIAEQLSINN